MLLLSRHPAMDSEQHYAHQVPYPHHQDQQPPQYPNWTDQQAFPPPQNQIAHSDSDAYSYAPVYSYPIQQTRVSQGQQLQPLMTSPPWPSMLASQNYYPHPSASFTHAQPHQPIQPAPSQSASQSGSNSTPHQPTPRRTLTDADRRRMCEYHAEHPNKKQTEIGEVFGVERSTVSKVLRHKDKYLNQEEASRSPTRKAKSKYPDIERTLATWVKKKHEAGGSPTDEAIRSQAQVFWIASGQVPEVYSHINSSHWLERFKQKYNLVPPPRPAKKRSPNMKNDTDAAPGLKRMRSSSFSTAHDNDDSPIESTMSQTANGSPNHTPILQMQQRMPFNKQQHGLGPGFVPDSTMMSTRKSHPDLGMESTTSPPLMSPDVVGGPAVNPSYYANDSLSHRTRSQTYPSLVDPYMSPPPTLSEATPQQVSPDAIVRDDLSVPYHHPNFYMPSTAANPPPPPSHDAKAEPSSPADSLPTPTSPALLTSPNFADARRGLETTLTFLTQHTAAGYINASEYHVMTQLAERWKRSGRAYTDDLTTAAAAAVPDDGDGHIQNLGRHLPGGMHHVSKQEFALRS